ncbi:MAG: bifunctional 4-hydroxy-3-methylbut-2-enyl diphosphate reductase/30S ribosomal protein S1 [Clostridiales bacterium]|nr:bifunctional 4-hydroxy-3-methylbut-2-enyl diphosphate reductase/30S ribosomal protein S1 [Clostridiales bacterium]
MNGWKIELAKSSGFCFGVENAVKTAYSVIKNHPDRKIYMLGEITHNEVVVGDLLASGMLLVHDPKEAEEGSLVLIRAHGVTPAVIEELSKRNCEIIDCTCPFVKKIHDIVRKADEEGHPVYITGTKGHPEVVGICGECSREATVISSFEECTALPEIEKDAVFVSQTTFSSKEFQKICEFVQKKIAKNQIFGTICYTTENRQRETADLAGVSDVMVVIGSKTSSNTKKLYDICSDRCALTYLVGGAADVEPLLPMWRERDVKRIGVTAGASTPVSIIREVIQTMSEENGVNTNPESNGDINFGDYVESIPQLRKNATVKGAITSYDGDFVYVDVHDKSEGRIPRSEFEPDFDFEAAASEKQEIEVYVKSIRNTDMGKEIILSKSHVDFSKNKAEIEAAYENKTPVTVKITGVVKDGVIANYGGVDIYIHRTQLELGTVNDLEAYKGKTIEILITQFDPDKRRLRVSGSRRSLLNAERKAKAEEVWNTIEKDKEYDGVVRSLTDFGAFVDIGGVDGLIHVSELSWNRIKHPSDVLSVGDEVHVNVKDFDPEKKRISLGYKKAEDDPFYNIEERIPAGSIVRGKVVRMFQFGAFVELEPNLDALCHISEISNVRLNKPQEVLKEGMEVEARVLEVNAASRRISISIKQVNPIDPQPKDEATEEEAAPVEEKVEDAVAEAPVEEVAAPVEEAVADAPVEEAPAEAAPAEEAAEEKPAE